MIHTRTSTLGMLMVAGALAATVACTATTNEVASQCHSQADCLKRGPEFAATTCSTDRICVPLNVEDRACNTTSDCAAKSGGTPSICNSEGRCVSLLSPECQRLYGEKEDLLDDNTIVIGNLDIGDVNGATSQQALDTARADIRFTLGGGLPPAKPGGPKRPLVIVSCTVEPLPTTGLGSEEQVRAALRHTLDELKVPIQIGPFSTPSIVARVQAVLDRNALSITQNSTAIISTLADKDLNFRSTWEERAPIPIVPPFYDQFIVPQVEALKIAAPGEKLRVAVVSEVLYRPMVESFRTIFPHDFQIFDVGATLDLLNVPNPATAQVKATLGIYEFKPHVIFWANIPPLVNSMFVPLNRTWPAGVPRPIQVAFQMNWSNLMIDAFKALNNDVIRQRFYGLEMRGIGQRQEDIDTLTQFLRLRFPELANVQTAQPTAAAYDTMFLLANAIVAVGDQPLNGTNLAKGVRRVADAAGGEEIQWGPAGLTASFAALARGANLSLSGATGKFLFDPAGNRPGNPSVYCITQKGGVPDQVVQSGFSYDTATNRSVGAVTNCN